MQNKYSIKNFRAFNEEGATFEFKPITILTGKNSAGKSSLTKSIMLLRGFFEQVQRDQNNHKIKDFNPMRYCLDFSDPALKLGGFDKEINRNAKTKEIGFSYTYAPSVAPIFEFTVNYWFRALENDRFNNGWLSRIEVFLGKDLILKATVREKDNLIDITHINLNSGTTGPFFKFYLIANYFYLERLQQDCINIGGGIVDGDRYFSLDASKKELEDCLTQNFDTYQSEVDEAFRFVSDDSRVFGPELDYTKAYPRLFDISLFTAVKKCDETALLFYFPVLEQLSGLSKEEQIARIKSAPLFIKTADMPGSGKDSIVDEIVDAYSKSEENDFIDFYRTLEDHKLDNLITHRPFPLRLLKDDNLMHRIRVASAISFNPNMFTSAKKGVVDFDKVYRFLSNWQWHETPQAEDDYFCRNIDSMETYSSSHKLYSAYQDYFVILLEELLVPRSFNDIHYIGNSHAGMKRLYAFEDKSDPFVNRISRYLTASREYENALASDPFQVAEKKKSKTKEQPFQVGDFINKWLVSLEIGKSLHFDIDQDALGVKLVLEKPDGEKTSLADEGFGINQMVGLLISIETEILQLKVSELTHRLVPVMGQPDPIPYISNPVTVVIEEPEINLHPSFQSKLAELFYDATSMFEGDKIHFIIETHSEYLIRKMQVMLIDPAYNNVSIEDNPFAIYYINSDHSVKKMEFRPDGSFKEPFGPGFIDEGTSLALSLLEKSL